MLYCSPLEYQCYNSSNFNINRPYYKIPRSNRSPSKRSKNTANIETTSNMFLATDVKIMQHYADILG